MIRES